MRKTLKATQEFFYGGRTLKEGEKFTAVDPDANILVVLGKATESTPDLVVEAAPVKDPKIETSDLKPEPQQSTDAAPRKRRYMRRDMTAEE